MSCPEGWRAPSVGYQNGCRCAACKGWRTRVDALARMRNAAIRAGRRRAKPQHPTWTPRSATSFYRDALDAISDRFV